MFFFLKKGLVTIAQQLNGLGSSLEPFPPGTFEEYSLAPDGTAKLLRKGTFHRPGDKPSFRPFVLYEGSYEQILFDPKVAWLLKRGSNLNQVYPKVVA